MPIEYWKVIKAFPNYAVSDLGRVKRITSGCGTKKGRFLKLLRGTHGYLIVCLHQKPLHKTFTVHRLVTEAFIGKRPAGKQVNHIDGNKPNNHLDNLEYISPSENEKHAFKSGLQPRPNLFGERNPNVKLRKIDIWAIRTIGKRISGPKLASIFGIGSSQIYNILNNTSWRKK